MSVCISPSWLSACMEFWRSGNVLVSINIDKGIDIAPLRESTAESLRYCTCSQGISQFYLHVQSAITISHTCLCLPSYSWYSSQLCQEQSSPAVFWMFLMQRVLLAIFIIFFWSFVSSQLFCFQFHFQTVYIPTIIIIIIIIIFRLSELTQGQ